MTARYVKVGDVGIPFTATLKDNTGAVVNLTGATVTFLMALAKRGSVLKVNAAAAIVGDPTLGNVRYTTVANDLNTEGTYFVEWKVTFGGGGVQRFDGQGFDHVVVGRNLG